MEPLTHGPETDLIEIPANWYLDGLPSMMLIKKAPNRQGFAEPRQLGEMSRDQLDYVYREYDCAVFALTMHPDVSGRPQVLLMHGRADRVHARSRRRAVRHLRPLAGPGGEWPSSSPHTRLSIPMEVREPDHAHAV